MKINLIKEELVTLTSSELENLLRYAIDSYLRAKIAYGESQSFQQVPRELAEILIADKNSVMTLVEERLKKIS